MNVRWVSRPTHRYFETNVVRRRSDRQLPTEPDGETGPLALHSPSREGAELPMLDTEIPATSARRTRKKADCCMCCGLRRVWCRVRDTEATD